MIKRHFEEAKEKLSEIVQAWGQAQVYMVGGCVRDLQLGEPVKDIDLCIDLPSGADLFVEYLKQSWSDCCKNFVTYPRFGTSKFSLVLKKGTELDIECVMPRVETYNSGPRKPDSVGYTSLEEDAKRRDFCCNALYMNVVSGKIIDPTGHGIQDIKDKILCTPLDAEQTFIDDPLRMLRAFRFAYQKDFTILPEVKEKIKPYPEYYKLSMERVRDEFTKILLCWDACGAIWDLHETGLLKYIIPEFEEAWGFNQNNKYHSLNLTDHSLAVLSKIIKDHYVHSQDTELKLAALLHDISKYKIHETKEDNTFSYHGHEIYSAEISEKILRRLKYSEETVQKVSLYIRSHMCIKQFYNYGLCTYTGKGKKTRELHRLFGRDNLRKIMRLIEADNMSHAPKYCMPGQVDSFWEAYEKDVVNYIPAQNNSFTQPVSGNEIMEEFKILQPGKLIGEIKNIFQSWFDEDGSLTKDMLFRKYRAEYEGKTFWIKRYSYCRPEATFQDPRIIKQENWEVPLSLDDNEYVFPKDYKEDIIEISAFEHPNLYERLVINKKSWGIIDEIEKAIDKFYSLPGFDGCSFDYSDGDFTGYIKWKNHGRTEIV